MSVHQWRTVRKKLLSAKDLKEVDRRVAKSAEEIDLRTLREKLGVTQDQLAKAARMDQAELSRFERRDDHRLSMLKRYVAGLGGTIQVVAVFKGKKVVLQGL